MQKLTKYNLFIKIFFFVALGLSACSNESNKDQSKIDFKSLSLEKLIAASEKGDSEAKLELAIKYLDGKIVDKDIEKSVLLLEQAAALGNAKAMFQLYGIYTFSEYNMQSDQKAESWLLKAAETGNPEYEYEYAGRNYYINDKKFVFFNTKSDSTEEKMKIFAKWNLSASDKKYPPAMLAHGTALLTGLTTEDPNKKGVAYDGGLVKVIIPKDANAAINLIVESADKGNFDAQWLLANIYQSGFDEIKENKEKSEKYWLMLRQLKNPEDIRSLGFKYSVYDKKNYKKPRNFEGKILTFEESEGLYFDFMKKAADLDDLPAMVSVAECYKDGRGTSKNPELAAFYYKKSAEKGDYSAQATLASLYFLGEGVPKDYELSKYWLLKAVSEPNPHKILSKAGWAQNLLGYLNYNGLGSNTDRVVAYAWYNLAATNGFEQAKENLSIVEKNLSKEELKEAQKLSREWRSGKDILRTQSQEINKPANVNSNPGSLKIYKVGTGFFIDKTGSILTNNHVVDNCIDIKIPSKNLSGKLVVFDQGNDIAIIKIDYISQDYLRFISDYSIRQGEDIFAFGFPLNGYLPTSGNISQGIISALSGPDNNSSMIQISAPIQLGNSGGPLLNKMGLVVGQVVAKANAIQIAKTTGDIPQNVNFAISNVTIKSFLKANNQKFSESKSIFSFSKSTVDIADVARNSSVKIECWR